MSTRTLLADDASDTAFEIQAEQQRLTATVAAHTWHGLPLSWTASRKTLYLWLRLPSPPLQEDTLQALRAAKDAREDAALQRQANALYQRDTAGDQSHYANATLILYLAANAPEAWKAFRHDKAAFLAAVEEWVDTHVRPEEVFDLADVTNALLEAAESTRAIPRPTGRGEEELGN